MARQERPLGDGVDALRFGRKAYNTDSIAEGILGYADRSKGGVTPVFYHRLTRIPLKILTPVFDMLEKEGWLKAKYGAYFYPAHYTEEKAQEAQPAPPRKGRPKGTVKEKKQLQAAQMRAADVMNYLAHNPGANAKSYVNDADKDSGVDETFDMLHRNGMIRMEDGGFYVEEKYKHPDDIDPYGALDAMEKRMGLSTEVAVYQASFHYYENVVKGLFVQGDAEPLRVRNYRALDRTKKYAPDKKGESVNVEPSPAGPGQPLPVPPPVKPNAEPFDMSKFMPESGMRYTPKRPVRANDGKSNFVTENKLGEVLDYMHGGRLTTTGELSAKFGLTSDAISRGIKGPGYAKGLATGYLQITPEGERRRELFTGKTSK